MGRKGFAGQRNALDLGLVGLRGHQDGAAQLAVDLQHQLDFVLHQRIGIDLGPGRIEQSPSTPA